MNKPRIDQGPDYERGFIDGMQYQMQSSVDKLINRMTQPEQKTDPCIDGSCDCCWKHLDEPEQEPVRREQKMFMEEQEFYAAPPQRKEPEQEPVAWMEKDVLPLTHIIKAVVRREKDETYTEPLYTTQPQRTWVGLTDEEAAATAYKGFDEYWTEDCKGSETEAWAAAGRAIEAKLKEKNT